jgi:hypothetical protein
MSKDLPSMLDVNLRLEEYSFCEFLDELLNVDRFDIIKIITIFQADDRFIVFVCLFNASHDIFAYHAMNCPRL